MNKAWLLAPALSLMCACGSSAAEQSAPESARANSLRPERPVDEIAETIVAGAIQFSGVSSLDSAVASFTFREASYTFQRRASSFGYTRERVDSTGDRVVDALDNAGLTRTVNGASTPLSQKQRTAYAESVNSVVYFAFLPLALGDEAVINAYEGADTLAGRAYHRVRVGFEAAGGGDDFEDEFLYWFDAEDLSLDFLAYSYATDGGGVRFREAFNARRVNGVEVQDYRNYRADPELSVPLDAMAEAWRNDGLTLLSLIELEDVRIQTEVD